ncbi:EAL domain-containing protein [Pseudocitrobacter faecalis]
MYYPNESEKYSGDAGDHRAPAKCCKRRCSGSLKNAGADLALDDFGTGFSNYEALQKIAPKFLKIDKMFIDTLTHGGVSEHIVDNIIHLSKSTGIPLIAEGIEDSEQAVKLISKGVTLGQGYLYSKPIPYQDFRRLL